MTLHNDKVYGYFFSDRLEEDIWRNCYFIFDTSSLLDLYLFSKSAQDEIFNNIFKHIEGKIGIPAQVEFEYLKNREKTLKKPITEKYEALKKEVLTKVVENIKDLKNRVEDLSNRTKNSDTHPILTSITTKALSDLTYQYEASFLKINDDISNEIKARENDINAYLHYDSVFEQLKKYVEVGEDYNFERVLEIIQEGETRYRLQISPGYKDAQGQTAKDGIARYGDLIIWKQIIDFAIKKQKAIIFVCNDLKDDWCYVKSKTSPKKVERPNEDLIKEIWDIAKVRFWMYSLSDFLYVANKQLNLNVNKKILEEVDSVTNNLWTIVDQEHIYPHNLSNTINEGRKYTGQIYQAGLTGKLVFISVSVDYTTVDNKSYPLLFGIYDVENDTPSICLLEFQVNRKNLNLNDEIGLPNSIQQIEGKKYAIIVSFMDAPRYDPWRPRGSWNGSSGNHYKNGGMCSSDDGLTWETSKYYSLHFRTYLIPD